MNHNRIITLSPVSVPRAGFIIRAYFYFHESGGCIMHKRSLRRSTVAILFSCLTIAVICGAFLFNSIFTRPTGVSAAGVSQPGYSVTRGTLTPAAVVNPMTLTLDAAPASTLPKGARPTHAKGHAGTIPAPASVLDSQSRVLENFNGVSSRDSAKVNFGAEFEPPDQGLCVGNGYVVEPVNSAYTIYRTDGSKVAGPFNVNKLYGEGFKQFTSDPRCFYDKTTNAWFAIILFISADGKLGRTDLAVNPTGNPTTPWTVYHINGTDNGGNGCPCFGDQPLLGIDQYNIYISTNEFSISGPQFNGAQIYAISKSQLVALSQKVNVVHFGNLNIGGSIAASVQPAFTYDTNANAEYFMNSLDPNGTFDDRLGVWALTDRQAVGKGGTPILSKVVISSEPYGYPPAAEQKGATTTIDSGDDRMQQTEFINHDLWGALDTAVTIPGDPTSRAGIAWFNVQPYLVGSTIRGATLRGQGYIALKGNYLLYPAIQVSPEGTAAIIMTLVGPTRYPSVAYAFMGAGWRSFGYVHLLADGHTHYSTSSTRWGDYSWAVLDPTGKSFWMATEYIPPKNSQTLDGVSNWGTRVVEISAEG